MSKRKNDEHGVVVSDDPFAGGAPSGAGGNGDGAAEGRQPETKLQRFTRLIERRMVRALKSLAAVAKLANRSQYAYEDEDAALVVADLEAGINAVRTAFAGRKSVENGWKLRR